MTALMEPPVHEPRYVIEHEGVGRWKRGDVVPLSEFTRLEADVDRLLGMRACRAATPLEYGQRHVDLASAEAALSYQHVLAEKDQQIARLTARVAELEQQLASGSQVTHSAVQREEARIFEEKDRTIHELQAKLRNITNQPPPPPSGAGGAGGSKAANAAKSNPQPA